MQEAMKYYQQTKLCSLTHPHNAAANNHNEAFSAPQATWHGSQEVD
jgi:hypothetical protein